MPSSPMRKSLPEEALSLWGECIITPGPVPIALRGEPPPPPAGPIAEGLILPSVPE